jgi:hypothetical protein
LTSPSSTPAATAPVISGPGAIRAGIAVLAAVAFALSYDALRQMAVAIHIRGLLTYTFPLVIDGFIAIGIGAQLMLRTAPRVSRFYVGTLIALATGVSIVANAVHAIRLNQQTRPNGLHLDNATVGALSALAPLALASAVRLYLVIRRHPTPHPQEANATESHNPVGRSHNGAGGPETAGPDDEAPSVAVPTVADVADACAYVASDDIEAAPTAHSSGEPLEHEPGEVSEDRLAIARTAPLGRGGRASRRHIEGTFRGQGLSIGRNEADQLKSILQAELDEAASKRQVEHGATAVGGA